MEESPRNCKYPAADAPTLPQMVEPHAIGEQQDYLTVATLGRTLREGAPMSAIALITGASSGLGRELVRQVDNGAAGHIDEIWVVARRADRLESLVRTCKTPVRPFCLDLEDDASFEILEAAFAEERASDELASIRLLVNNAGSGTFGAFAQQDRAAATQMMSLLMRAPVELTYRALPYMAPGSRIINVASVAAFLPQPKLAVYAAAKRFILDLSRALDAELGSAGIHVTALCPKFMRTEFLNDPGDTGTAACMEMAIGYERVQDVAAAALKAAAAGKSLCIPSLDMKLLYAATRVAPYRLALAAERALGVI